MIAPVLGIVLILLGLAFFGFYLWGQAPLEEPANPGRTPNPSRMPEGEWEWRIIVLRILLHRYAILAGVVFVGIGAVLLLPERTKPS